jgi:hypothetical protein
VDGLRTQHCRAILWVAKVTIGEPSIKAVITVGMDIAMHVYQVHRIDHDGNAVLRRRLRREEVVSFFDLLPPWLELRLAPRPTTALEF